MNKEFKTGDKVRRINAHNGHRAQIGQEAVVDAVSSTLIWVSYEGVKEPEAWDKRNAALVTTACKFIPGNEYKDAEGRNYKFLLYVPEAKSPYERAVFINQYGSIVFRHEDGDHASTQARLDILPNKEIRTIAVYRLPSTQLVATDVQGAEIPEDWKLLGEVEEEVEVY